MVREHITAVRWPDVLIAFVAFLVDVTLFSPLLFGRSPLEGPQLAVVPLYAATGSAVLIWRRQAPLMVFSIVWLHSLLALVLTPDYHPTSTLLVAIAAVAASHRAAVSLPVTGLAMIPNAFTIGQIAKYSTSELRVNELIVSTAGYLMMNVGSWLVGRWSGKHRRRLQISEQGRFEALEREKSSAERILAERQRIARELHDIVAHSVTLMVLHAAAAARVLDQDAESSKRSLKVIENSGTQAMGELRRMLGLLRQPGSDIPATEDSASLAGLNRLDELIKTATVDGLKVNLHVTGQARNLDPSVDLAAYRLLQEALTNVARHAGPGTATDVLIGWDDEWVNFVVEDDGAGEPNATVKSFSTGNGLLGLRERVTIAGGTMQAESLPGRGYRLTARLPVAAGPSEDVQETVSRSDSGYRQPKATGDMRPSVSKGMRRSHDPHLDRPDAGSFG